MSTTFSSFDNNGNKHYKKLELFSVFGAARRASELTQKTQITQQGSDVSSDGTTIPTIDSPSHEYEHLRALVLRPDSFGLTPYKHSLLSQFQRALNSDDSKKLAELLEKHPEMAPFFLKDAELLPQKLWETLSSIFKALSTKGVLPPALENIINSLELKRSLRKDSEENTLKNGTEMEGQNNQDCLTAGI